MTDNSFRWQFLLAFLDFSDGFARPIDACGERFYIEEVEQHWKDDTSWVVKNDWEQRETAASWRRAAIPL